MPNTRVNSISVISYNVYYRLYCIIIVSVYICQTALDQWLVVAIPSWSVLSHPSTHLTTTRACPEEQWRAKWSTLRSTHTQRPNGALFPVSNATKVHPKSHLGTFFACVCAWIFSQRVTYELVLQRMAHFGCFCSLWSDNIWFYQLPLKKKTSFDRIRYCLMQLTILLIQSQLLHLRPHSPWQQWGGGSSPRSRLPARPHNRCASPPPPTWGRVEGDGKV